jgi:hypothetical protein
MEILLILPYGFGIFTAFGLSIYVGAKNLGLTPKNFLRAIVWYMPIWAFAIVATILVPNDIDETIIPIKICSFFLPLFWSIVLYVVWSWSEKSKKNDDNSRNLSGGQKR